MDLILPYRIEPPGKTISHKDKILMLGSCFSEHIGKRMAEDKWEILVNPTGNIFNPISIFKTLHGKLSSDHQVTRDGRFSHWDIHSNLSVDSSEKLTTIIEAKNQEIQKWTSGCSWVILTFGTAFVYRLKSTNQIVANCHKVPQAQFEKQLLTEAEIVHAFDQLYGELKGVNPNVKWLFTVSPVKHLRDGLTENHISKGTLLKAVQEIINQHPDTYYFPAYELVTDVLRDYRFYDRDFAHPNEMAISFIWERFLESVIAEDGKRFILRWKHIKQALKHRPLHPHSKEHQLFLQQIITDLNAFSTEVDISGELQHFQNQLNTQ